MSDAITYTEVETAENITRQVEIPLSVALAVLFSLGWGRQPTEDGDK